MQAAAAIKRYVKIFYMIGPKGGQITVTRLTGGGKRAATPGGPFPCHGDGLFVTAGHRLVATRPAVTAGRCIGSSPKGKHKREANHH